MGEPGLDRNRFEQAINQNGIKMKNAHPLAQNISFVLLLMWGVSKWLLWKDFFSRKLDRYFLTSSTAVPTVKMDLSGAGNHDWGKQRRGGTFFLRYEGPPS